LESVLELDTANIIRDLVAPAVMISAAGLLVLSTNARLVAVLTQLRALHHERAELLSRLQSGDRTERHVKSLRLDGLRSQTSVMLASARWMRFTLIALFLSIVLMILCSACLGISTVAESFYPGAIVCFGLGTFAIATGMIASAVEVAGVLRGATFEHQRVGSLGLDALGDEEFA
jgi:hypothetical protein